MGILSRSQRRRLRAVMASACAALASVVTPPGAGAQAATETTVNRFEQPGTIENPCSGDVILFTFEVQIVTHTTLNGSGGFLFRSFENATFDGTGASGVDYIGHLSLNESFNFQPAVPITVVNPLRIVSKGTGPNFVVRSIEHLTFNANGELTSSHVEFDPRCVGSQGRG